MLRYFRQALLLLSPWERKRVYLVLLSSAAAAIVQALSILSVMPFIVLLTNPEMLDTHPLLRQAYDYVGAGSYQEFTLWVGLLAIAVITMGNLFVAFEQWLSLRFLANLEAKVEATVLRRILGKPYEFLVGNPTARLSDVVLRQVERVMEGVIGTFVTIFSSLSLAVFILLMLLVISLKTTLLTLLGLLVAYVAVYLLTRGHIEDEGEELTQLSGKVFTAVKDTLEGIREIKTRRAEAFFTRRFSESRRRISRIAVRYEVVGFLPHYLLETVVFAGFVGVALYFIYTTDDPGVSLSYLALYGMAVYRLAPALREIFEGISTVHHNADAIQTVRELADDEPPRLAGLPMDAPRQGILLDGVSYRYPGAERQQLDDVRLFIPAGSSACLFGPSGSGKSTILNLVAGLIQAQTGRVRIDGTVLEASTVDGWRQRVGYSPQRIYLFADTLAANIAFGVPAGEIDRVRVKEAGRLAGLEKVVAQLPEGYDTQIVEDGGTLSGGQRQRIGIARVLYHDPDVLIFDESFGALDAETRGGILNELFALPGKTLIFSSHETSVASRCGIIAVVEQGRIVAEGGYQQLVEESPRFNELLSRIELGMPAP